MPAHRDIEKELADMRTSINYEVQSWISDFGQPPEKMLLPNPFLDNVRLTTLIGFIKESMTDEQQQEFELRYLTNIRDIVRENHKEQLAAAKKHALLVAQKPGLLGPTGEPLAL